MTCQRFEYPGSLNFEIESRPVTKKLYHPKMDSITEPRFHKHPKTTLRIMFAIQPPNHWTRMNFWLYFHMTADVLDPADGIFSDLQAPSPSPVPETQVCVLIVLGCKPGGSTTAFSDGYCPIVTCFPMGPTKRIETGIGGVPGCRMTHRCGWPTVLHILPKVGRDHPAEE
jgi:hypothetical protein